MLWTLVQVGQEGGLCIHTLSLFELCLNPFNIVVFLLCYTSGFRGGFQTFVVLLFVCEGGVKGEGVLR